jgi:hypothetical protein
MRPPCSVSVSTGTFLSPSAFIGKLNVLLTVPLGGMKRG